MKTNFRAEWPRIDSIITVLIFLDQQLMSPFPSLARSMVTLVCALAIDLGHPFVIDLLETCILEDLRLAVAQRNPDVIKCPLRKLELFCAQRDGKWPTTAETRELDPEALDLERLDYPLFRLDHAGFGDRDVSANTHVVHVVRVSKNHELQHASEPTMTLADVEERFESAVKNVTNSYADKQSVYGFSECTYSKEEEFIEKLGLSTKMLEVKEELEFSVKGCNWEESDHYCQRVRYLAYMDEHLKDALFPNGKPQYFMHRPRICFPVMLQAR